MEGGQDHNENCRLVRFGALVVLDGSFFEQKLMAILVTKGMAHHTTSVISHASRVTLVRARNRLRRLT